MGGLREWARVEAFREPSIRKHVDTETLFASNSTRQSAFPLVYSFSGSSCTIFSSNQSPLLWLSAFPRFARICIFVLGVRRSALDHMAEAGGSGAGAGSDPSHRRHQVLEVGATSLFVGHSVRIGGSPTAPARPTADGEETLRGGKARGARQSRPQLHAQSSFTRRPFSAHPNPAPFPSLQSSSACALAARR